MELKTNKLITLYILYSLINQGVFLYGQNTGQVSGNFQIDAQIYEEDSVIGAANVPEKTLMQGFGNINYLNRKFSAGIRYEAYLNPLLGFDPRYKGTGIPYRYAQYKGEEIDITAGSFYEQFGNGLLLRAYESRNLGYDNAFDGFRVKSNIYRGVYLKGVYGNQRFYFSKGEGIVRGVDAEVNINELHDSLDLLKTRITIGASFVSKYQKDVNSQLVLPENVGSYAFRTNIYHGPISFLAEYAYKYNDPSSDNGFIYKEGQALLVNTSFAKKGFSVSLTAKTNDNMSFRSDRTANLNDLLINYLPATTKQHTYNLVTLYPYAVQPNGEVGFQGDVSYKIKKKTLLGGKYGTNISFNIATVYGLDSSKVENDSLLKGYTTNFFQKEERYFRDINLQLNKKINKKLKLIYSYYNILYNMGVIQGLVGKGTVNASIHVLDVSYKIKKGHNIRIEVQHLATNKNKKYYKDQGNWGTLLAEYTISPKWFFAILDQYNYGNDNQDKKVHYLMGSLGYIKNSTRVTLGYGRQREGIFCVGGVCRNVPASNGLSLSITSSF
jgi:hypothetical protein